MSKTDLFQTIQFSISTQFHVKRVLSQVIQFSISTHFSFIWLINRTLSSATTPDQSGDGSNGTEGVLFIPQSFSIIGTSPPDCLLSYLIEGGVLFMQSVYSTRWLGNIFLSSGFRFCAPTCWRWIILKLMYLTDRLDPNRHYHSVV